MTLVGKPSRINSQASLRLTTHATNILHMLHVWHIYWLVVSTPLKKYDFVSWDDDIPNIWKNVPNHQSEL